MRSQGINQFWEKKKKKISCLLCRGGEFLPTQQGAQVSPVAPHACVPADIVMHKVAHFHGCEEEAALLSVSTDSPHQPPPINPSLSPAQLRQGCLALPEGRGIDGGAAGQVHGSKSLLWLRRGSPALTC